MTENNILTCGNAVLQVEFLPQAEDARLDGYYCKVKLWQDNFWKKPKKNYHKKPKWAKCYLVQRSQIESQLNGADSWELRTQWDILLLFLDILTKYSIVFSTLSRQHHSAVTQFGFFEIQINEGFFLKRFVFLPWNISWNSFDVQ